MISMKGKTHFWSQLLVSMIAIFALPAAQGLIQQTEPQGDSYQRQAQQIQQRIFTIASLTRQGQTTPTQPQQSAVESGKLFQIEPHFIAQVFPFHMPIRGSPSV